MKAVVEAIGEGIGRYAIGVAAKRSHEELARLREQLRLTDKALVVATERLTAADAENQELRKRWWRAAGKKRR